MIAKCPGQDTQFWKPGDVYNIDCPQCGRPIEFFKDDIRRRCETCGHMFINPKLHLGCAKWCQFADQCVGVIGKDEFKEIIILAIKEHYGANEEKITNALKILAFAEDLLEQKNGNPKVVIAASLLYDIGIHEMERNTGTDKESDQEKGNLPMVRDILERAGSKNELIDEVCRIIESHREPKQFKTINANIVHDAVYKAKFKHGKAPHHAGN
jgi:hypothetical protein